MTFYDLYSKNQTLPGGRTIENKRMFVDFAWFLNIKEVTTSPPQALFWKTNIHAIIHFMTNHDLLWKIVIPEMCFRYCLKNLFLKCVVLALSELFLFSTWKTVPKIRNPTLTTSTITARRKGDTKHMLRDFVFGCLEMYFRVLGVFCIIIY